MSCIHVMDNQSSTPVKSSNSMPSNKVFRSSLYSALKQSQLQALHIWVIFSGSGRNKSQKLVSRFFEDGTFCGLLMAFPLKMYSKFGWPNVEIGWKMGNGQLLFLGLF